MGWYHRFDMVSRKNRVITKFDMVSILHQPRMFDMFDMEVRT